MIDMTHNQHQTIINPSNGNNALVNGMPHHPYMGPMWGKVGIVPLEFQKVLLLFYSLSPASLLKVFYIDTFLIKNE